MMMPGCTKMTIFMLKKWVSELMSLDQDDVVAVDPVDKLLIPEERQLLPTGLTINGVAVEAVL